jgi:hypothetical protein
MSQQDNLTDKEKMMLATEGIRSFVEQFGEDDVFRSILLDILMERLYGEDIHLPRQAGQEGDQNHHNGPGTCPADEGK